MTWRMFAGLSRGGPPAVSEPGSLWAWGYNAYGQLGDGTTANKSSPIRTGALTDWASVISWSGGGHTGAIKTDGTLWMWGDGVFGKLGNGGTSNYSSPIKIGTVTNWRSVYSGFYFSGGVRTDGTAWLWGNNTSGQLGDSTRTSASTPIQLGALTTWKSLHPCKGNAVASILAIKTDGTLWGWGTSLNSSLGDLAGVTRSSPVQVGTDTNWKTIEYFGENAGTLNAVGIKTDGTLWGWGVNASGSVGKGNVSWYQTPTQISTLTDWSSLSAGEAAVVAIKTDGSLWSWGGNSYGALGSGTVTPRSSPVRVGTLTDWKSISLGQWPSGGASEAALAIKTDGTLWVWGYCSFAGAVLGNTVNLSSPTKVGALTDWASVSAGIAGLAIKTIAPPPSGSEPGALYAWGPNWSGNIGDGTVAVHKSTPVHIGALTDWRNAAASSNFSAATKTDGTLWAWGGNYYGQLGDGTVTHRSSPIKVGALTDWRVVAGGNAQRAAAIKTDGTLWVWGDNTNSVLGDGTGTHKSSPTKIGALTDWAGVSVGGVNFAAIKTDGTLWAWGQNANGQLGDGTVVDKSSPIKVGALTDWRQVAAFEHHCAAIKTDGTLWTWGYNNVGQLGDGTVAARSSPTKIGALTDWALVAVGNSGTTALKTDGTLWTWGNSVALGDGTGTHRSSPVRVGALTDWATVWSGSGHRAAIKTDGTLWTWGSNNDGVLGDGTITTRTSPVKIGVLTDWGTMAAGAHTIAIKR